MTEPLSPRVRNSARAPTALSAEDLHLTDSVRYPGARDDTGMAPERELPPSTPRWVKVFGITAVVLVLLFAGLHLTGNAPTHMPGSSSPEHGMQAP